MQDGKLAGPFELSPKEIDIGNASLFFGAPMTDRQVSILKFK